MKQFSTAKNKYSNLVEFLVRSPIYRNYRINTDVETENDSEIIDYSIEMINGIQEKVPFTMNHVVFMENADVKLLKKIIYGDYELDLYCPSCKKERGIRNRKVNEVSNKYLNFELDRIDQYSSHEDIEYTENKVELDAKERYKQLIDNNFDPDGTYNLILECVSKAKHQFTIIFKTDFESIMKIGQFPPSGAFNRSIEKYEKVLTGSQNKKDLKDAVQLEGLGFFIGAYTHLRRILERMVNEKFETLINNNIYKYIGKKEIENLTVVEKAKEIEDYLPSHLKEVRTTLYSILSEGIHSLDKQKSEQYYDDLYKAIIIILDEKLENREKSLHKGNNVKKLNTANSELVRNKKG